MPSRELPTRVMGLARRSRPVALPAEATLERETALPVSVQATPSSTPASNVDGFPWVIDEPLPDLPRRLVFPGDTGVSSRNDGSRVRVAHVADDDVTSH